MIREIIDAVETYNMVIAFNAGAAACIGTKYGTVVGEATCEVGEHVRKYAVTKFAGWLENMDKKDEQPQSE